MGQFWLHPAISHLAHQIDGLFYLILWITGIAFVAVEGMLIYFLLRYRRRRSDAYGVSIHGNTPLEIIWTLVPAAIFVWLGVISVKYVYAIQTPPASPVKIQVIGHQWYWEFKYPGGLDTFNKFYVPEGVNVEFQITSVDVIHGFFIPRMRLQQDAVPGHETILWLNADRTGNFMLRCDQYCGVQHAFMYTPMHVLPAAQWSAWLHGQEHPAAKAAAPRPHSGGAGGLRT